MKLIQRISFIGLSFLLVFSVLRLLSAQKRLAVTQKAGRKAIVMKGPGQAKDILTFNRKCS